MIVGGDFATGFGSFTPLIGVTHENGKVKFDGPPAILGYSKSVTLRSDRAYLLTQRVRLVSGTDSVFTTEVNGPGIAAVLKTDASGAITQDGTNKGSLHGSPVKERVLRFTLRPTQTGEAQLAWSLSAIDGAGVWTLDDVELEEVKLVLTNQIRAAIRADLETVVGLRVMARAGASDTRPPSVRPTVGGEGSRADFEGGAQATGISTQTFPFYLETTGSDAQKDADDLLDSIRNAVESSSSNTLALDAVRQCAVTSWEQDQREEGDGYGITLEVTAEYDYTLGSL